MTDDEKIMEGVNSQANSGSAIDQDGNIVTASTETQDAENTAQQAEADAKNTTTEASNVAVVSGTTSADNVADAVEQKQAKAVVAGQQADASWDKDKVRNSEDYKHLRNVYSDAKEEDLKRVKEMFGGLTTLDENQQALLQYCDDRLSKNEIANPDKDYSVNTKRYSLEAQPQSATPPMPANKFTTPIWRKRVQQKEVEYKPIPINRKGENGLTAQETIDAEGFDKDGNPKVVAWSAKNTSSDTEKSYADATDEYTQALEEARRKKDEALEKVMDNSVGVSDKADAIEKMAAADEIIRRYSDPSYVKRRKASKVLGMIADAFAAMGNMITAAKGGVPAKYESASAKVRQQEKEEEAALQKRVDYWTKRMNSARDSDLRSARFLQSRGITAALNDFTAAQYQAQNILNTKKTMIREHSTAQTASNNAQTKLINEHNKKAEAYQKKVDNENTYQQHRSQKLSDAKSLAKYRNSLPPKKSKGGGGKKKSSGGSNLEVIF